MPLSADYTEVLEHLRTLTPELAPERPGAPTRKFDLMHMRVLLAALGEPQTKFRCVLIAGTNGKGSTAATLASILSAAGVNAGLYTSPHLVRVNERMQLSMPVEPTEESAGGMPATRGRVKLQPIADDEFARLYVRVDDVGDRLVEQKLLPHAASFFERLTAIAFLWFAERKVELAVLEVGLGGRLDATNVVEPLLSILTDISLDHQEYLGETLSAITREKAGILRAHGTLITLPQHPEVNETLGEIAAELPGLRAVSAAELIPPAGRESVSGSARTKHGLLPEAEYDVLLDGRRLHLRSPLVGHHQQRNLALALAAVSELRNRHGYDLPDEDVVAGVRATHWPGRLEVLRYESRRILLDVAHNPAGAWTLRSAVAQVDAAQPRTLLFSCLRDKDLGEMAQILFPLFDGASTDPERQRDHLVLVTMDSPRAATMESLHREAHRLEVPAHVAPHTAGGLRQALAVTPPDGYIVVTGSVYLIGAIRQILSGGQV